MHGRFLICTALIFLALSGNPAVAATGWNNTAFTAQAGTFLAGFYATPTVNNEDVVIGLSPGPAAAYTDLAVIVRFNSSGFIDAYNGTAYGAATPTSYTANSSYYFNISVNLSQHTYSVSVTPPGTSAPVVLAANYAFRNTQAGATQLANLAVGSDTGGATVANFIAVAQLAGAINWSAAAHPFVFGTQAQYSALLTSSNPSAKQALSYLETLVTSEVQNSAGYTTTYSGCDLNTYLSQLTKEGSGAAQAAADLALYAYLTNLNLGYGQPALASQAQTLAKRILLFWATGTSTENAGFLRTSPNGPLVTDPTQYCACTNGTCTADPLDVGLQIGRGMPNWVQAQDLLSAIPNVLTSDQTTQLNQFLSQVDKLLLNSANYWTVAWGAADACQGYSNHASMHVLAKLAIERCLSDLPDFLDTAGAGQNLIDPWNLQVAENIYGKNDHPRPCEANTEPPLTPSSTAANTPEGIYQISTVQPGEVDDRYRSGYSQTLGYPMYSLSSLLLGGEILKNVGLSPQTFNGPQQQSLVLALSYYSYYFSTFLSPSLDVVTPGTPAYPGETQYLYHQVCSDNAATINGADGNLLPFVLGQCLSPGSIGAATVINKAATFQQTYTPFFHVQSIGYNCLPSL